LHHSDYPKLIVIPVLPILFLVLSGNVNASPEINTINIISPSNNSQVQIGNLTVTGTAVYDSSQPCSVYATWNNSRSLQHSANIINVGKNYSMWKFTFDPKSHEIIQGPNTLTAILSCVNLSTDNITTLSSIQVNGLGKLHDALSNMGSEFSDMAPNTGQSNTQEDSDVFSSNNFELPIPITKENETKYDFPITNEFERINRINISSTLQDNNTLTSAIPPSILEIESNQNSDRFLSDSTGTRVVADAGLDQTVYEGTPVILNGSGSKSNNNVILSYEWKQIPNPNITVGSANTMMWSFIAPYVSTDTTLTFELILTDNKGVASTDEVNINVRDGNKIANEAELTDGFLANESHISKTDSSPEPRNLIIQTLVDENPVSKGEEQVIKIDLIDGNSDDRINNATIRGQILDSSEKIIKEFSEGNDTMELSLNIPENSKTGDYVIKVNAIAPGYISSNTETNFKVQK
jgi:K319L-like, PKD domain